MRSRRSRRTAAPNHKPRRRRHNRIRAAAARQGTTKPRRATDPANDSGSRSTNRKYRPLHQATRQPQLEPKTHSRPSEGPDSRSTNRKYRPPHQAARQPQLEPKAHGQHIERIRQLLHETEPTSGKAKQRGKTARQKIRFHRSPLRNASSDAYRTLQYHDMVKNRAPARHPSTSGLQSISPHSDTAASEADEAPCLIASAAAAHTTPPQPQSSPKDMRPYPEAAATAAAAHASPTAARPDDAPSAASGSNENGVSLVKETPHAKRPDGRIRNRCPRGC